jgi:nucleoid DNA-binding protein
MNLREWARATHQALDDQPAEFRLKHFSMEDVEAILRMSTNVLVAKLDQGEELRLNNLGRLWVEEKQPRRVVSNLTGDAQAFKVRQRRTARFRASVELFHKLNSTGGEDS